MSENDHDEHHINYPKIYFILLALLGVSIAGPELEIRIVTLITAFGVAVVKAYLVAKNFMHIDMAPRYVSYLCATGLVFMLLFFAGTAPDVMKEEGAGWEKPAWKAASAAYAEKSQGEHGADEHH